MNCIALSLDHILDLPARGLLGSFAWGQPNWFIKSGIWNFVYIHKCTSFFRNKIEIPKDERATSARRTNDSFIHPAAEGMPQHTHKDCHQTVLYSTYHTVEVDAIVVSRVGKVDEVTASDWHLVGIQLKNKILETEENGVGDMALAVVGRHTMKKIFPQNSSRRCPPSMIFRKQQRTSALKVPIEVVKVAILDMVMDYKLKTLV